MWRSCVRRSVRNVRTSQNVVYIALAAKHARTLIQDTVAYDFSRCLTIDSRDSIERKVGNLPRNHLQKRGNPTTDSSERDKEVSFDIVSDSKIRRLEDAALTIQDASREMNAIHSRCASLPPLPPVWSEAKVLVDGDRNALFENTLDLLRRIEVSVQKNTIRPSGKYGRDLSHILGQALFVLQETPPSESGAPVVFRYCCKVLKWLRRWNLDLQPRHYDSAINAAARSSMWKEASDLFWIQIDPDASGYMPMDVSCRNPLGLYSIARYTQSTGGATAEQVMDAVLKMCMVSPTDQDKYVMAAGTALGLAGEWEACVNYLKERNDHQSLGPPLIAASMYACILCNRHAEALALFGNLVDGPLLSGREWQWGGESDAIDPICRDLAMRAFCADTSETDNTSSVRAMHYFRETEREGVSISVEALKGVVAACEKDGAVEDAVAVLGAVVEKIKDPKWLVAGNEFTGIVNEEDHDRAFLLPLREDLEEIILSVVRTCNASGRFGLALLCYRLIECELLSGQSHIEFSDPWMSTEFPIQVEGSEMEKSLLPVVFGMTQAEDVLVSIMVSLCGLGCTDQAVRLHQMVMTLSQQQCENSDFTDAVTSWSKAKEYDSHARFLAATTDTSLENTYERAHRHIHRLTAAMWAIKNSRHEISQNQRESLAAATAKMMRCCTAAGQSDAGIFLANRTKDTMVYNSSRTPNTIKGAVSSFFGLNKWSDEHVEVVDRFVYNDSVLAETINAYRENGWTAKVSDLLASRMDASSPDWSVQITNEALRTLVNQARIKDAFILFRDMQTHNSETYPILANGLANERQWGEVLNLYHEALKGGYLSEDLAFLAMKSIAASNSGLTKMRLLRNIVKETARIAGIDSTHWQHSRYWELKRTLGWYFARLLMRWNDPITSRDKEFDFALQYFDDRRKASLAPKNDAIQCIVSGALRYAHETEHIDPTESGEWVELLVNVLDEAGRSSLRRSPEFVDNVANVFRTLSANAECIDFVIDAIGRGVLINEATQNSALQAKEDAGLENVNLDVLFR